MKASKYLWFFVFIGMLAGCNPSSNIPNDETFTVSFNSTGGTAVGTIIVEKDQAVVLPSPEKIGYTFKGWFIGDSENSPELSSGEKITQNIVLYAKWEINQYIISFDTVGGSPIGSIAAFYNDEIQQPAEPTKEGHTFLGWYTDIAQEDALAFSVMPAQDLTLYAKWQVNQYFISFDTVGGSPIGSIAAFYNDEIQQPAEPTKEGHTFLGWYTDIAQEDAFAFSVMPAQDLTLYAKWQINQYKITYIIGNNEYAEEMFLLYPNEEIIQISLGGHHSSALTSNGRVFMWGWNYDNQLGDGGMSSLRFSPMDITDQFHLNSEESIVSVALGNYHSSAVTSSGRVFMWGLNDCGQLGDNTTINSSIPMDITSRFNLSQGETVLELFLGGWHSSALTSAGRLFMWGSNSSGELGDGTLINKTIPTDITPLFNLTQGETIVNASLGSRSSSAITSSGRMFTWGDNWYGKLGNGNTDAQSAPVDITSHFNLMDGEKITQSAVGMTHSSAITSNSRIFTWGSNIARIGSWHISYRSLPENITSLLGLNQEESIVKISAGHFHYSVLTSFGRIFMFGNNEEGQFGNGIAIDQYGFLETTSYFNLTQQEIIVDISMGGQFSSAFTSNGRFFTWGRNEFGTLGDGTTNHKHSPNELGIAHFHEEVWSFSSAVSAYSPLKQGFSFSGWYQDADMTVPYLPTTMLAEDIVLYGYWIPNE